MSGRDPDYEQTQRERRAAIRKRWSDMPRLTEPLPDERDDQIARLSAEFERLRGALYGLMAWESAVFGAEGRYRHAMNKANTEPDIIFDRWMDDVDELRVEFLKARAALAPQQQADATGGEGITDHERGWRSAVECAAEIAESYEPRCDTCPRGVATAIRHRLGPKLPAPPRTDADTGEGRG